ncbi:hypothetical protein FSARC_10387 [Fusarium sarcochroum]|uniref:Xylanolytic transcriptional activator regulatory domain-containing protein n=1 Tax=Fusarium sarcochroum TaxID=1208366 RepID=A0A8H4TMS2_9HYPO|nr:hypothetical protein FSARC_10387 [Fusarium sarcochroum]
MSANRPFCCTQCPKVFTRNARFSRRDVCKRHAERCRGGQDNAEQYHSQDFDDPQPVNNFVDDQGSSSAATNSVSPDVVQDDLVCNPDTDQTTSSLLLPGDPGISHDTHIAAYFEYFHPSFPLLHRPTAVKRRPDLMTKIIIAIGSLYTARTLPEPDASACMKWSQSLWEAGHSELGRLAWLLHIFYGAYMGDASQHYKAKSLLRALIDVVQDLGLLKQSAMSGESQYWIDALAQEEVEENEAELHARWLKFADKEAMKLCMHTLLFLDFHILYPCNIRSLASAVDLCWELPFSRTLWESDSAVAWLDELHRDPRALDIHEPDEEMFLGTTCHTLFLAMQSLMSDTPNPEILSALEVSPISIIFLLTSLDSLVRDLTRSYYQLPPTLSDPSAFHILTQSQNRQVAAVLRHVSRIAKERLRSNSTSDEAIWTGIERMALATKISLYKPDDLLIGGIVDNSVVAGLATATHLTLGRYTGSRRSLYSLMKHNSGDDAVLFVLEDTMDALSSTFNGNGSTSDALFEPPWVTVATYRILLASWRSFRWAASEIRGGDNPARIRYDTPSVIFNAIASATFGGELIPSPVTGEASFTEAIRRFWKARSVWSIGSSMVPVLNEIVSAGI